MTPQQSTKYSSLLIGNARAVTVNAPTHVFGKEILTTCNDKNGQKSGLRKM
jgi:hypothetical protein